MRLVFSTSLLSIVADFNKDNLSVCRILRGNLRACYSFRGSPDFDGYSSAHIRQSVSTRNAHGQLSDSIRLLPALYVDAAAADGKENGNSNAAKRLYHRSGKLEMNPVEKFGEACDLAEETANEAQK